MSQHNSHNKLVEPRLSQVISSNSSNSKSNSISSEDTVIAATSGCDIIVASDCKQVNKEEEEEDNNNKSDNEANTGSQKKTRNSLKSLLVHFAGQHLNLFNHHSSSPTHTPSNPTSPGRLGQNRKLSNNDTQSAEQAPSNLFLSFAQKYFNFGVPAETSPSTPTRSCRSCPATPIKSSSSSSSSNGKLPNGLTISKTGSVKPSVRFLENESSGNRSKRSVAAAAVKFAECGVQTPATPSRIDEGVAATFIEDDAERAKLVEAMFKLPGDSHAGEAQAQPMNSSQFKSTGYKLIDYICYYLDTIRERRVTPINIEPGYLKSLIQPAAPERGEPFAQIMHDFEEHIMCGITHWQHPHFHAYFPAGNAYPSILADMLGDALGCVGFSWAASPAYTELEIIMLDWMGKMIGLPDEFLCLANSSANNKEPINQTTETAAANSKGGGVIQGSASECVLVNLLAARHWAMDKLRKKYPGTPDGMLLSKLIGYCSKEAHSCVEKAAMIGFIRMRALDTDERHSLRGETLRRAMEADIAQGLEPFIVCATLGTTSCVSFDNLRELGEVCREHDNLWLHVDAAYAGSALICPEFKYLIDGIELATSFNMNPNKWLLINFDCSLMWVKDRFKLTRAFVVDPLYLQHSFSDQAIDYRHWGIPLSRRFRALKLWFVIRNYGIEGLRAYIRNHVRLAKLFARLIEQDARFTLTNEVTLGLVCFRLVGSNALNQRLLSMINASGKLHMVPASLNGRYIIRFCVCQQNAQERDIEYAYECISQTASELFELIKSGKERIRAISQQNTIDVSNISLHTQQSASADPLDNAQQEDVSPEVAQQVTAAATPRHVLRRSSRHETVEFAENGEQLSEDQLIKRQASSPADDLEQEVPIDSLASINGCDYDLDDVDALDAYDSDDDLMHVETPEGQRNSKEPQPQQQPQQVHDDERFAKALKASLMNDSISPIQRGRLSRSSGKSNRSYSTRTNTDVHSNGLTNGGANDDDEAADELVKLVDKRNRMSLRYKREFFVRVVSDPRVYRASISGDINAHASTNSLGSSQQLVSDAAAAAAATTSTSTGGPIKMAAGSAPTQPGAGKQVERAQKFS